MSYHKLSTNSLNSSVKVLLKRGAHLGLGIGAFTPMLALANPTGGQVVAGSATIRTPSANGTVINQTSKSAIIDWTQFNIGAGQYVQFIQPSSSSVVLNRVIGGSPSSIFGNLTANGQVFLVNTNGVFFGKSGSIDAQGFLASTLDISNANFLNGSYIFDKTGSDATVVNQGSITAHKGGYVVLAGDYTENDGIISAQSGHIVLASGAKGTLTLNGNSLVNFAVDQATLAQLAGADNSGKLIADGGTVIMTADVANLLKATVVNNTGLVEAHVISKSGGSIQLLASGGNIVNAGTLDASAMHGGEQGGDITLKGDERTSLTSQSRILAKGDGANGGNLELSGNTLSVRGVAMLGKGGNLLLDPNQVEIVTGTNSAGSHLGTASGESAQIGVTFIQTQLNNNTNVEISAHNAIFASGNVHNITATGKGNLELRTTANGTVDLFGVDIAIGGKLTASMGYGDFGHLTASSVELNAGSDVDLAGAVKNGKGKITQQSVVATTGTININAPHVFSDSELGSGGLALKAGRGVNINAHTDIGGNLNLAGRTIDVNGAISAANVTAVASNGYAHLNNITATNGTVSITANIGTSPSGDSLDVGDITAKSITVAKNGGTSGNVTVGDIHDGSGDVSITDTGTNTQVKTGGLSGQNITVTNTGGGISAGYANATGVLTIAASAEGNIHFSDGSVVHGNKGVTINGGHIFGSGNLNITAQSGDVTLGAGIGFDSGEQYQGNVDIDASGGAVKLGQNIYAHGNVDIQGATLAYTGKAHQLTISAGNSAEHGGGLELQANIGSAAAPVKYSVNLDDTSGAILISKSIFTTGSIVAHQVHGGSAQLQGVLVGSNEGGAVTLSAAKDIKLTGANIGIGAVNTSSHAHSSAGAITLNAGGDVDLTADGSGSHSGGVGIQAGIAFGNKGTLNHGILIQATGDINISGQDVDLRGGEAGFSSGTSGHHTITAKDIANVSLIAGGNIGIHAVNSANISAGTGGLFGGAEHGGIVNATLDTSVNMTAGSSISITAHRVQISHGYGATIMFGEGKGSIITGNDNLSVNIKAGAGLSIKGSGSSAEAGVYVGEEGRLFNFGQLVDAEGGATLTANVNASINLSGKGIGISGHHVLLSGGYGAFSAGNLHDPHGVGADSATATFKGNADINLNAGAGGIELAGTGEGPGSFGVQVRGGRDVAAFTSFVGASYGGVASDSAHAAVNIKTTGNLQVIGRNYLEVSGGGYGALDADVEARSKGTAKLTTNGGVTLSAKNITMSSGEAGGGFVSIQGGDSVGAFNGRAQASNGGVVQISNKGRVDITATGNIQVFTDRFVSIAAGDAAGANQSGSIEASSGGKTTIANDAGVAFTAKGNINLFANDGAGPSSHSVTVRGGNSAGVHRGYFASGGQLNVTDTARVDITAGGSFTAHAGSVYLHGGDAAGSDLGLFANSSTGHVGKATLNADASVNVTAGSVALTGHRVQISAGYGAGAEIDEQANGVKAATAFAANGGVNFTVAGALTVEAGFRDWFAGGSFTGVDALVVASGGKAAYSANDAINVNAGSVLLNNSEGGRQSLFGRNGDGVDNSVVGQSGGSANVSINAGVNMTVAGIFEAQGAGVILLTGNSAGGAPRLGLGVEASNTGTGKVASTINNGIAISAKSVTLSASDSVEMFAGEDDLQGALVRANGGTATLSANSGINLTAAQGITVNVTGTGGSFGTHRRIVLVGGSDADGMVVNAGHGGNAALNFADGITLKAGGAITLSNKGVTASGTTGGTAGRSGSHGIALVAGSRIGGSFTTISGSLGSHHNHHQTQVVSGVGGGTVSLTADASVNITAKGAFAASAGSGFLVVTGGSSAGRSAAVVARAAGKANMSVTEDLNITAASAQFSGGSAVFAAGGVRDGAHMFVGASHAGVATANVVSALNITTKGALSVDAERISITGGAASGATGLGLLASGAAISASHGAQASLVATSNVQFKAGSVSLTAEDGFVHIFAGALDGSDASVFALGKGDKASATITSTINVTATTGGIAITAKRGPSSGSSHRGDIGISAGSSAAVGEGVIAGGAGATAALTFDNSVNFTAKTSFVAEASGQMHLAAATGLGAGGFFSATGKGAKTTVSQTGALNITAASVTLGASDEIEVFGGQALGAGAFIGGTHSGSAAVKQVASINVKSAGAISITGSSSVVVAAGEGASSSGRTIADASHHGVANLSQLAGVSLQAGGNLTITARDNLIITARGNPFSSSVRGYEGDINAQEGGTATLTRDASLTLSAGGVLRASAGSNVFVIGGVKNRLTSNTFARGSSTIGLNASNSIPSNSHGAGKATGTLTAGINFTAGSDVDLGAGSNLIIAAGAGNQLFVGAARIHGGFSGERWNGGTATLSANTSVTITAGRDLNLVAGGAGTGSLQVLGMGYAGGSFDNQANVRGGSSSAVAKLTLVGNATLTAKRDINVFAGGNASIVGGSLGNLRADHAVGNVTILGSADATLKAGRDVNLGNIEGSLTVAGINVNSTHSGGILADAHADHGFASVTGHADAAIVAARNITTGNGSLGGGLNVVAGQFVHVAVLGLASSQHATATANASLTAGGSVTIKGHGDLNVLGGLFDSAAITNNPGNGDSSASGTRVATLQARGTITALGAVTLNLGGDGVIAGGDGLGAKASLSGDRFLTGTIAADAGVLIKGSSVSITVGGNLLMRGGSSVNAQANGITSAGDGDVKATATASADAAIVATGNVTINVGSGSNGDASFVGGSVGRAGALNFGSDNAANATVHADLSITAGKAISVNAGGNIRIAGGPGAENSAFVLAGLAPIPVFSSSSAGANSGTAIAAVSGKVNFTAGSTLAVHAHGTLSILGGSRGGDDAIVSANGGSLGGRDDSASMTVDTSVTLKAKGTVTLTADSDGATGAGFVNVTTYLPSHGSSLPIVASSGSANVAKVAGINGSVSILGKTVTINGTLNETPGSGASVSFHKPSYINDTITITGLPTVGTTGFHPAGVRMGTESIKLAPAESTTSFGNMQTLDGASVTPAASQPAVSVGEGFQLTAPTVTSLETLQSQGLVLDLVTLLAAPAPKAGQITVFLPGTAVTGSSSEFPSSCAALVLKAEAAQRCAAGGK